MERFCIWLLAYKARLRYALLIVLGVLLVAGTALAAGERIPRSVATSGGGAQSTATVQLRVAVGQPLAGTISGAARLCSGLICGAGVPDTPDPGAPGSALYLPLVVQ